MHNALVSSASPLVGGGASIVAPVRAPCAADGRGDPAFLAMLNAYRGSGGLARVQELLAWFEQRRGPDLATLARWIVERRVIAVEWQADTWLPWFQFDRDDMTPRAALRPLLAELEPFQDPWQLAGWFVRPSTWLAERLPVDVLDTEPHEVMHAARADRFVARG